MVKVRTTPVRTVAVPALTGTGIIVVSVVMLATATVLVVIVMRVWRCPSCKPVTAEVEASGRTLADEEFATGIVQVR